MCLNEDFKSTHNLAAWALAYELGDSAAYELSEELSALLQAPVANHGIVYRSNLFKNCIGDTMFRLNRGQEGLMPLVGRLLAFIGKHVILAQARQCVRDELMNFLSRNMAQVEVFILQIKFPSLYLPGQCDVKVGQVHMVSLQDEVTIVE
jgi:hypothetical protein